MVNIDTSSNMIILYKLTALLYHPTKTEKCTLHLTSAVDFYILKFILNNKLNLIPAT